MQCCLYKEKKGKKHCCLLSWFKEVQPGRGQVTRWGMIGEVWDLWVLTGLGLIWAFLWSWQQGGAGVKLQGSWVSHQVGEQHQQRCQFCPLNRNEGAWACQALPLCNYMTRSSRELSCFFTPGYMNNFKCPSSSELLDFYPFAIHVRQRRNKAWESRKVKGGVPRWLAVSQQ